MSRLRDRPRGRLEPLLLRVEEAALVLGLSRSKVFAMLAAGELPVVRIGRSVRVPKAQLEFWIRHQAEEEERKRDERWVHYFGPRKEALIADDEDLG